MQYRGAKLYSIYSTNEIEDVVVHLQNILKNEGREEHNRNICDYDGNHDLCAPLASQNSLDGTTIIINTTPEDASRSSPVYTDTASSAEGIE